MSNKKFINYGKENNSIDILSKNAKEDGERCDSRENSEERQTVLFKKSDKPNHILMDQRRSSRSSDNSADMKCISNNSDQTSPKKTPKNHECYEPEHSTSGKKMKSQTPTFILSDETSHRYNADTQNRTSSNTNFIEKESLTNDCMLSTTRFDYYKKNNYIELEETFNIFEEMDTFLSRNNKLKSVNRVFTKVFVFNAKVDPNMPISEVGENEEESECLSNSLLTKNIELITCQRENLLLLEDENMHLNQS